MSAPGQGRGRRTAEVSDLWEENPMRRPRWLAAGAIPLAVALAISSCSSGDEGGSGEEPTGGGDPAKNETTEITVFGTAPERPLVPGDTSETGGGKVVDAIFTGLMDYDPVSGEPGEANAESFELTAPDEYTVKLKKDWTFHDGTPVTADSYIDAWNYTAYGPNAQQHASFFAQIEGFSDVWTEDPDGVDGPATAPTPATDKLSGLTKVNDFEFKIKFTEPHAVFKVKAGYAAFMPLPKSFFADPEAWKQNPVGNGGFKYVGQVPDQSLSIERFDDYKGEDKPKIKKVKFVFSDSDAAYVDVKGNNLDFLDTVPPQAIAGNVWQDDLPGRAKAYPVMSIQAISFPLYNPKYQSVDFRHAISMAIDREQITKTIFEGNRKPIKGYAMDKVPGYEDGACGKWCEYNPEEAKKLFDKSGWTGPIQITSNADGGHKEWIEAACGQIEEALKVECTFEPVTTFAEVREAINARQIDKIYRAGWLADYPLVENFLNPIYRTGASSNDNDYSNPEVDAKLAAADAAETTEEAYQLYHEAEELIAEDMPGIPLWDTPAISAWSERLTNVRLTPKRELDLSYGEVK
jgi:oligopeptide transport system substrate-binding protein